MTILRVEVKQSQGDDVIVRLGLIATGFIFHGEYLELLRIELGASVSDFSGWGGDHYPNAPFDFNTSTN